MQHTLAPLQVPGRLSGWLHARFPIPRSSTGSSAPTHGIPDTKLSTLICKRQLPKQKERVLFPRSLSELHRVPVRRRLRQMCCDSTHTHTHKLQSLESVKFSTDLLGFFRSVSLEAKFSLYNSPPKAATKLLSYDEQKFTRPCLSSCSNAVCPYPQVSPYFNSNGF